MSIGVRSAKSDAAEFLAAYDAVLKAWERQVEVIEISTVDGTVRINQCGPDDGSPLVLLHGGGATSTVWGTTISGLDAARRVLAIDVLGDVGRSVPIGEPLRSPADHARWLESTLDALGLDAIDLCGHSYGGWLALNFALRCPGRVRRLALIAPTACFAGLRIRYILRAIPMLARPAEDRTRRFLAWEAGARALDEHWLAVAALGSTLPTPAPGRPRRPSIEELRSLTIPVLVVLAEHDRSHNNKLVARRAGQFVPDVQIKTLSGASHHSTPASEGPALASVLEEFLLSGPATRRSQSAQK